MTGKRSESDVVGHDPELAGAIYETDQQAGPNEHENDVSTERSDTVRDLNRFQSQTVPPEQARAMMQVDLRAVDDGASAGEPAADTAQDDDLDETPEPAIDPGAHEIEPSSESPRASRRALAIGAVALVVGVVGVVAAVAVFGGRTTPTAAAGLAGQVASPRRAGQPAVVKPPASAHPVAAPAGSARSSMAGGSRGGLVATAPAPAREHRAETTRAAPVRTSHPRTSAQGKRTTAPPATKRTAEPAPSASTPFHRLF